MAKKKLKTHGDSMIYRIAHNDPQEIIDWFNAQSNFSESIRLLIAKDIRDKNGHIEDLRFASVLSRNHLVNTYIQPTVSQMKTPKIINDGLNSEKDVGLKEDTFVENTTEPQMEIQKNEEIKIEPQEKEEIQVDTKKKKVERDINIANW